MQWVLDNWLLILLGGGMVAMHLFGHGHGGHGGRRDDTGPTAPNSGAGAPADRAERDRDT